MRKDSRIDRVGEQNYNRYNELMIIIAYRNAEDIDVLFKETEYVAYNIQYQYFKKGTILTPFTKTICGVGYLGIGEYDTSNLAYIKWNNMINRCYNEKYHKGKPSYTSCTVCPEWHNFQNFAKWFYDNYYVLIDDENMSLDKDILKKGNKVYSPDVCVFVDFKINSLFTNCKRARGECPVGVNLRGSKYIVRLSKHNKEKQERIEIGRFNSLEEAFYAYKHAKEDYIKQVADEYKNKYPNFPQRLYDAMYKYEVEITD